MPLSIQQVEHVARLAKLNLSAAEIEKFTVELTVVLEYIDQLKGVATNESNAEHTGGSRTCPLREDTVGPSLDATAVLELAPSHTKEFILVPKVLG